MVVCRKHLDTGTSTQASSREHVRTMGLLSDHAGHVAARILGGSGTEQQNLVPLNPGTNRQLYHQVEKKIAEGVRKYGRAQYYLNFMYDKNDTRPHTIRYYFNYGSVVEEGSLPNPE